MRSRSNPRTLLFELAIIAAVAAYYIGGNLLFEPPREPALQNARDLIALQDRVGLNVEPQIQHFFEGVPGSLQLFVFFYAGPHFVLTYGFLLWTYWFRFGSYAYVRNAFALYTVSAFTFQWIFPVAPPRMVPELGLGDWVTDTLPINGETPWIKALVNDVAALPSVHTGWALLVAVCAIRLTSSRWRWLWLAYPAMIIASILATANHFVWDIVAALAWLGATESAHAALSHRMPRVFHAPSPASASHLRLPTPVPEPVAETTEAQA
jgi:PAP2 superfamily protein